MPDAHDTLTIFAEIAVAIAGFSGIVIAFGRRSLGSLTALELRRLSNLFALSGFVLVASLLEISLLHIDSLDPTTLWRGASAVMFAAGVPWLARDWAKIRQLEVAERSQVKAYVIYPFNALAITGLAMQAINVFHGLAWPYFVALVIMVLFAFQQFVLLVRMGFNGGADGGPGPEPRRVATDA